MQVNILEAKNSLSRLVSAVERGEEVVLARNGKPVAKIVRYQLPPAKPPGTMRGRIRVSPDWNSAETNAAIAAEFEGLAP